METVDLPVNPQVKGLNAEDESSTEFNTLLNFGSVPKRLPKPGRKSVDYRLRLQASVSVQK